MKTARAAMLLTWAACFVSFPAIATPECLNDAKKLATEGTTLPVAAASTIAHPMTLGPMLEALRAPQSDPAIDPKGLLNPYLELASRPGVQKEARELYEKAYQLMETRNRAAKKYELLSRNSNPTNPDDHAALVGRAREEYFQHRDAYDANQRQLGKIRMAMRVKELHDSGKIVQVVTQMSAADMHGLHYNGPADLAPWGEEAPPMLLLLKPNTEFTRVYGQDSGMFGGYATFPSRLSFEPRTAQQASRNRMATPHGDYSNSLVRAAKFTFSKPQTTGEMPSTEPVLAWIGTTGPLYPNNGEVRGDVVAPNGDKYASGTLGTPGGVVQVFLGNGRWKYLDDGSAPNLPASIGWQREIHNGKPVIAIQTKNPYLNRDEHLIRDVQVLTHLLDIQTDITRDLFVERRNRVFDEMAAGKPHTEYRQGSDLPSGWRDSADYRENYFRIRRTLQQLKEANLLIASSSGRFPSNDVQVARETLSEIQVLEEELEELRPVTPRMTRGS